MKTILRFALTVIMMFNFTVVPVFAESSTANQMSLEETMGYVVIKNSAGTMINVRDGGRLYSGYQIMTSSGYAWINLDDTKVIKLDRYSKITIKKDGDKLEVLLETGNMFFDVSEPLEDNERLDIKTSTMYTSIRGTIGMVSTYVEDVYDEDSGDTSVERISTITLYEGKVDITTQENNEQTTETIYASQQAIVSKATDGEVVEVIDINATQSIEQNPYIAVELADNAQLKERIEVATESNLDEVSQNSEKLLEDYESVVDDIATAVEEEISTTTDALDTPTITPATSTGTSSTTYYYTVNYYVGEILFASDSVKGGTNAVNPTLKPTANGEWQLNEVTYDFETSVKSAIDLVWVDFDVNNDV